MKATLARLRVSAQQSEVETRLAGISACLEEWLAMPAPSSTTFHSEQQQGHSKAANSAAPSTPQGGNVCDQSYCTTP